MKIPNHFSRFSANFFQLSSLLLLVSALNAQVPEQHPRMGHPQDWTSRHLVFNRQLFAAYPQLAALEPRIQHQFFRETRSAAAVAMSTGAEQRAIAPQPDWQLGLGTGRVASGMSPAKYNFDDNAPPDCTNDYVVYGLNVAGVTGGQANLIAFNNLYRGPGPGLCGTGAATLLFSYNISTAGGVISTSPVLSLDGTKIAFVESAGASSIFHVLTWATGPGNGTSATNAAFPGTGNTASMISLTYAATASNTRSSPWIDYVNDVAYVGADDGRIYKITGVFKGTPALAGAPWPVLVIANARISAPVLDQFTRNIFLGDPRGVLFSFNVDTPGALKQLAVGLLGSQNPGINDGPLVDAANGTVFAVSSNDGTSAVLVQADTTTLAQMTRARIGRGSTGAGAVELHDGAFNNDYFTDPSTGFIFVCGTGQADTTPRRYFFGFTGRVLDSGPMGSGQMVASANARCSPVTEYFNPNIGAGGTDFFFWGLTTGCVGASGCVRSRTDAGVVTSVAEAGGTSAIIIDNNSVAPQASSIYFNNLAGVNSRAVKLTQSGLQ